MNPNEVFTRSPVLLFAVFVAALVLLQYFGLLSDTGSFTNTKAIAVLNGERVQGTVYFEQERGKGPVRVTGYVRSLDPNAERGFHIHQFGDLSNGCASTGAHYNPDWKHHGAPTDSERHVGDLGNIRSNSSGIALLNIVDEQLSLNGKHTIIGRAVVVHTGTDDLGRGGAPDSKTTGHAGGRAACGVIGLTP